MTLDDKRNYQMLVAFGFLVTGGHAHGINALIPAEKMCKATPGGDWLVSNLKDADGACARRALSRSAVV